MSAAVHGLEGAAREIAVALKEEADAAAEKEKESRREPAQAMLPPLPRQNGLLYPPPVLSQQEDFNWPVLTTNKGFFDAAVAEREKGGDAGALGDLGAEEVDIGGAGGGWGDDLDLPGEEDEGAGDGVGSGMEGMEEELVGDGEGDGWDDLDIPDDMEVPALAAASGPGGFICPQPGPTIPQLWVRNSTLAPHHVAAGSFDSAMGIFNTQAGIVNFAPLKPFFMSLYAASSTTLDTFPNAPPQIMHIQRFSDASSSKSTLPVLQNSIQVLTELHNVLDRFTYGSVNLYGYPRSLIS